MKVANIDIKDTATRVAGTLAGVAAGSILKKNLTTSQTVEGLAGEAKNYIVPTIMLLGGAVISGMSSNKMINSAALGFSAVGGASMVNELFGKQVVSLGRCGSVGRVNTARRYPAIPRQSMKGVEPLYPGMSGENPILYPGMSGASANALSLLSNP